MAITAVGVVAGTGRGAQELLGAMRRHGGAVGPLPEAVAGSIPEGRAVVACELPEPEGFSDDRKVALLAEAARQVLAGSPQAAPERRGVFLGTGLSSVTPREIDEDVLPFVREGRVHGARAMEHLEPGVAPGRHLPHRATAWLARQWGATGPLGTTFSACAAGAEAIAAAARSVARGECDVALAGGQDAMVHPLGLASFYLLGVLGEGRPFDRRRDGFVMGEGAALLRLEPLQTARDPLAVLLGAGTSLDAHGITAPHPRGRGAEDAMRRALVDAQLPPQAVQWVSAHGTGTPLGDAAEAQAIARVFGPGTPTSSLKGAVGHCLAAAGAVEAVAAILCLRHGLVHGTVGCEEPDDLGVEVVLRPRKQALGCLVSNSFGFGGQNCSLVLAHPEWP